MAAQLFYLPFRPAINANGITVPGAQLFFYSTGTTTKLPVYTTSALTTELTNPVEANAAGVWPAIYLDNTQVYRVVLKDADGVTLDDADPYLVDIVDTLTEDLQDIADIVVANAAAATSAALAAEGDAAIASASALTAVNAPGTTANTKTSLGFGTGNRTFTIGTGKAFVTGQYVTIAEVADPVNIMYGPITAHDPSTGSMTVNVQATYGSGTTAANWNVGLSAPAGVGTGTVTSVSGTGTVNGITLTGTVTTSGGLTLGGTLSGVNLASQVTGTLPIANGGTGATSAANARTALGAAASGANTDITALDQDVTVTATGTIAANSIGFRGLPQNSQTGAYALVLADAGKHISITTGGVTIPANASVAFPVGTTIVVYNNSGSTQSVAITTDTLRLAGSASTGTRTVAQYGFCTLVKVASTVWVASGNVT